jgi:phosphoribosylglycinamide formyltransferase 1
MKIVIFTSNSLRHKYLANSLSSLVDDSLIISECKSSDDYDEKNDFSLIDEHFKLRYETEKKYFSDNKFFIGNVLPLMYKEVNLKSTFDIVKKFQPDLMIVFGSSIIREPYLSLLAPGRFINLHLGLSPYYRGSGTNFWPFVNEELQFVGSTILHLDSGIDTGDIICHVLPKIELKDDVHTIGCKVIQESVKQLSKIILLIQQDMELPRIKQWKINNEKYYKNNDFNEKILLDYKEKLRNGLIENFLKSTKYPKLCLMD